MINMTGMDKHDLLTAFDEEQKHDDGCRTVHLLTALLLALAGIVRVVAGRPAATIASRAPKSAPDRGKDTPARAGIVRRRKGPVRGLRRGHVRTHTLKLHARIERANRQRDALRPTSTRHALATREHATAVAGWRVSNRKRRSAEREVRRDEKRVKDSVAIWNKCVYRARVYSTRKAVGPCGLPLPAPYLLHVRGGDETSPARDYAARDDYEAAQRRAGEAREAAAGSRRRLEVGRQVEAADRERALRAVAELVWARREARTAAVAAPHRALTLAHRRQWAMVERRRRRVKRREMPPPPLPAAAQHAEPTPQHQPPKPPPPSLPSAPPIELTSKLPPIWSPHLCADWPGERGVWRRRPWTTVWLLFLLGGFCLEGNPRGKAERETMQRALVINVCGLKAVERPGSIGAARTREAGESMLWDASTKLMDIVTMIKEGGVSIAVLADTHHTETMDEVVIRLLEEEFGLCAFATAGGMNAETVSRGVMIVWDPREVEFDGKDACKVVMEERIVRARLKFLRDGRRISWYGSYMPCRGGCTEEVREAWDALDDDALIESGEGRLVAIGGDLNAEVEKWREARGGNTSMADRRLDELIEKLELVPQARGATWRSGTQIDNWLVSSELDGHLGRADTLPGICGDDHRGVVMNYYSDIGPVHDRVERPIGSPAARLKDAEAAWDTWLEAASKVWEEAKRGMADGVGGSERLRVAISMLCVLRVPRVGPCGPW